MPKYYVLGGTASIFWDPVSKLKVVTTDESNPAELNGNVTDRIKQAVKAGHIVEVKGFKPKKEKEEIVERETEVETKKSSKPAPPVTPAKTDLTKMTKDELIAYYKNNYETTDEDIKNFSAMKPKAMVEFLQDEDQVD